MIWVLNLLTSLLSWLLSTGIMVAMLRRILRDAVLVYGHRDGTRAWFGVQNPEAILLRGPVSISVTTVGEGGAFLEAPRLTSAPGALRIVNGQVSGQEARMAEGGRMHYCMLAQEMRPLERWLIEVKTNGRENYVELDLGIGSVEKKGEIGTLKVSLQVRDGWAAGGRRGASLDGIALALAMGAAVPTYALFVTLGTLASRHSVLETIDWRLDVPIIGVLLMSVWVAFKTCKRPLTPLIVPLMTRRETP